MTTEPRPPISDNELHALADGRLDPVRAAEIERLIADRPDDQRRLAAYRRIDEGLHALYDSVLDEVIPERLRRRPRRAWHRGVWARIAGGAVAAVLLLGIGATGGWYARDARLAARQEQVAILQPAALAHRIYVAERRHPVEVRAEEEHLVRWLSNRLKIQLKTPELGPMGFKLMGGRLLPTDRGSAAQFMYEDAQGRRVTLYIRSDLQGNRETAFRYVQDETGVGMFYWIDGAKGYAIAAQMPRDELIQIAQKVYDELEKAP